VWSIWQGFDQIHRTLQCETYLFQKFTNNALLRRTFLLMTSQTSCEYDRFSVSYPGNCSKFPQILSKYFQIILQISIILIQLIIVYNQIQNKFISAAENDIKTSSFF